MQARGMEWGGRREEGSGWGTHYVNFKNKIKLKKNKVRSEQA